MKEAITISTSQAGTNADFESLRQEALKILQQLGGAVWTDHNRHDPGITILEQLCYAISDLCYRISFDVPDILANGDGPDGLHTPYDILTGNPVTLADLRRIVLDVPGVRNAWIEPRSFEVSYRREDRSLTAETWPEATRISIKGMYTILVEVIEENLGSSVKDLVKMRTQACRPVAEDFIDIVILKEQPITVKASLEIGQVEDPEGFLARVYQAIDETISPTPRFFTLQEMQQQGYATEDIMNGPKLIHGFLKDEDNSATRKPAILTSDLVQVIHSIPGLIAVKNIQLTSRSQVRDWKLSIDADRVPKLATNFEQGRQDIELFRNGIRLHVDNDLVGKRFREIKARNKKRILSHHEMDIIPPRKPSRHIDLYHFLQHHFPGIYALTDGGLSANVTPTRQAQLTQLRAYLFFFDQILASFHAQLGHLHHLFAFNAGSAYSEKLPDDVPGLSFLIPERQRYKDQLSAWSQAEEEEKKQRSRSLNHLMARFAEDFTQFSMLAPETGSRKDFEDRWKINLLTDYPGISGDRGQAPDNLNAADMGGLEKRILLKLGLSADGPRHFYMVEHILLRPTGSDRFQQPAFMKLETDSDILPADEEIDPFSLQLTYLFTSSASRKIAAGVIEPVLREETPAHIQAAIIWLPDNDKEFKKIYSLWRFEMERVTNPFRLRGLRNWLIDFLAIGRTYPISDLLMPVPRIVPYGSKGKVVLPYGELGVTYQLVNDKYTGPGVPGNNDTVDLETEDLKEDTEFTVIAEKKGHQLKTSLNTRLFFKVGIDTVLDISIQETAPVPWGTTVTLVINDSQEKVAYKLFDAAGNALSEATQGNGEKISISTTRLTEDVAIVLKASKTFDDTGETQPEIVTIRSIPMTVRPNPDLEVVAGPVIPYQSSAGILLKNTQTSVYYKVHYNTFRENDIVYGTRGDDGPVWPARYSPEQRESIIVREPKGAFSETEEFQGTGADLTIQTPQLTDDQLVYITATKVRGGVTDQLVLTRKPMVLLQPRTDLTWEAPESVTAGTSAEVRVTNPELGVTYQLVNAADRSAAGALLHFHKNVGIEMARMEVDFVVDSIEAVVLITPALEADSQFRIRATRLYTGTSVVVEDVITIKVSENATEENPQDPEDRA